MYKRSLLLKKLCAFLLLFTFSFSSLIFADESQVIHAEGYTVSQPVKNSMWYICKKAGNKAGKIQFGPFESRIDAIAAWYYYSPLKSSCLAENMKFITSNPEEDFPEDYQNVKVELEENHAQALTKFSIKPVAKIEKKYIKKTKTLTEDSKIYEIDLYSIQKKITFENKLTADFTAKLDLKFPKDLTVKAGDKIILKWKGKFDNDIPRLSLNFLNETSVIAENISDDEFFEGFKVFEVSENLPEELAVVLFYPSSVTESSVWDLAKRSDRIDLNQAKTEEAEAVEELESENADEASENENPENDGEPEAAEEENPFEFIPSEIKSDLPLSRYKKEYLQDYAVTDDFSIPSPASEEKPAVKLIPNPNQKDKDGRSDLMKAAASGNEWQVKNLLESGAKIDLTDNDGWTALMYAARYSDSLATLELLLSAKADVKKTNKYGSSALLIAVCYNNNPKVISRLMEYYQPSDRELLKAFVILLTSSSSQNYIMNAKIELFIRKEIPLNTFYKGKTPLMYAAQFASSTEVIKILLDHDAVKSLRSVEGKTVFDYAKENTKLDHDDIYWSLNSK